MGIIIKILNNTRGKFIAMALIAKTKEQKLNLQEATTLSGIEDNEFAKWLRGTVNPANEDVEAICNHLGCSSDEIYRSVNANMLKHNIPTNVGSQNKRTAKKPNKPEIISSKNMMLDPKTSKTTPDIAMSKQPAFLQKNDTPNVTKDQAVNFEPGEINKDKQGMPEDENEVKETTDKKFSIKNMVLSEESESYVRKITGLKKGTPVERDIIHTAFRLASETIKKSLDELINLENDITMKLYENLEANIIDPKLQELIEAANNASVDGIELAITILKKWRK